MLAPWSVALVNYRGFGESTGWPTPEAALADALLIYDTLAQRADVDPERVAVIGYSLGTGVAVHVAERRPTVAVALFAPYDSLKLVQPGASPLYAPLQSMMKPYFTPIESAPNIQAPMLALVGSEDDVFPADLSRRLAEAWGGAAEVRVYDGERHWLSESNDASWREVAGFLAEASGRAE
jgi:pimeloyl-ACP methyl ester carboxylesterase